VTIRYDFNSWPKDANELTVRLAGWFSLNYWLVV
jgi:hypothetical protein